MLRRHQISLEHMAGDARRPWRILLLHGWSPGPRLPRSLRHPGFEVDEIPTTGICDVLVSPCGIAFFTLPFLALAAVAAGWGVAHSLLGASIGAVVGTAVLVLVVIGVAVGMWVLKQRAVGWVVKAGVRAIKAKIRSNGGAPYDVLAAYSWGGGAAVAASALGVHAGPILLFAPASSMLLGHAGQASKLLRLNNAPRVVLVHGAQDGIVPCRHSTALWQSAQADGVAIQWVTGRDDHFLHRLAPPERIRRWLEWLVDDDAADAEEEEEEEEEEAGGDRATDLKGGVW